MATPPVDIYENESELLLVADIAGVCKEDLSINFKDSVLTLEGCRDLEVPGSNQQTSFECLEYRRTFSIPAGIDAEAINADLKNGVLRLHLPKSAAMMRHQIEVKSE